MIRAIEPLIGIGVVPPIFKMYFSVNLRFGPDAGAIMRTSCPIAMNSLARCQT